MRLVIDTNVLISHVLLRHSIPGRMVDHAFQHHHVLASDIYFAEIEHVLSRKKFDAYISVNERVLFLQRIYKTCENIVILQQVNACRDAKDNMILEIALNGKADRIITGDKDLLVLHCFRSIPIITPAQYV